MASPSGYFDASTPVVQSTDRRLSGATTAEPALRLDDEEVEKRAEKVEEARGRVARACSTSSRMAANEDQRATHSRRRGLDEKKDEEAGSTFAAIATAPRPVRPKPYMAPSGTPGVPPPEDYVYEKLQQKSPRAVDHLSITLGPPMIILFDVVVPIIIYYAWYNANVANWEADCAPYVARNEACPNPKPEYNKDILGYAVISFGFGELYILIARVIRLWKHRDLCAPLLSRSKWELDATSWVYLVAMIMALIPFVVGSSLELQHLYLYGPSFLMGFLGLLMLATLIPFPLPIGINSHARGTPCRPFIYYAAEDFIAVDGLQDREFRVRYNARYDHSKAFRRLFLYLTWWWISGVVIFIGCVSAVIWLLEFHYAFGASLGVLFAYIIIWAGVSVLWVKRETNREKQLWASGRGKSDAGMGV